ncbi:molybdopterin-synthase adenylyltransferase MoeB [Thermomonas alba]|uniref:molybdopterin-synthase adenylyltransferase MoeB n=1 Tax=Thermomonas alba TaxID=2888525 RepID=UPI001F045A5B|nr:molybdopterin-synthase adenylyltransferase MoeB [Thermomonas alba]
MTTHTPELSPEEALARLQAGIPLLDVRGDGERAAGMAEGARAVALNQLLASPERWLPGPEAEVGLICATGVRTRAAVERLRAQGYARLWSVAGGTRRWAQAGLPMTAAQESPEFLERYSRHLRLPEVGLEGQRRLRSARVALLGAGGLGCPAALYLTAAGIGRLTVIDGDVVERSNLQRQVLHGEADIGRAKTSSARDRLHALNPDIRIIEQPVRLDADNVDALLRNHDVVIDGTDNFFTRYLVNAACIRLGIPWVYGAVERFRGQVAVFDPHPGSRHGCYQCVFPQPPPPELAPNCAEAGVLGVLPGLIGLLQATEAIKLLLGIGTSLRGRMLAVDALGMEFEQIPLGRDPDCTACGTPDCQLLPKLRHHCQASR